MNTGTVISGDKEKGTVSVKMERDFACGKCGRCKSFGDSTMLLEAVNACGAVPGDTVSITMEESLFFKALLWLYGVPFAALMLGFAGGVYAGEILGVNAPLTGFAAGIILMSIAYLLVKKLRAGKDLAHRPVADKKL